MGDPTTLSCTSLQIVIILSMTGGPSSTMENWNFIEFMVLN